MLCLDTLQPFRDSARRGSLLGRGTYQSGLGRVGVMVVADWPTISIVILINLLSQGNPRFTA